MAEYLPKRNRQFEAVNSRLTAEFQQICVRAKQTAPSAEVSQTLLRTPQRYVRIGNTIRPVGPPPTVVTNVSHAHWNQKSLQCVLALQEAERNLADQQELCMVWKSLLPESVELFNISQDPSEATNVAAWHPEIVSKLRVRANALAAVGAKPLILMTEFQAIRERLAMPPALPGHDFDLQENDNHRNSAQMNSWRVRNVRLGVGGLFQVDILQSDRKLLYLRRRSTTAVIIPPFQG